MGALDSQAIERSASFTYSLKDAMRIKSTDLVSLFEKSLQKVPQKELEEIGIVVQVGDGICKVHGLINAVYGELINFEGGNRGIIFNLDEDEVAIFLLYNTVTVAELEVARRTGEVFKAPVGPQLLGRVIDATGKPLDALGELNAKEFNPVEAPIAQIIERSPVNESL